MHARLLIALAAALSLLACKSAKEKYLEQVESSWQEAVRTAPAGDEALASHFQAFLDHYPPSAPEGNPRAAEAAQRITDARAHVAAAAQAARAAEDAALQQQLQPLLIDALWRLLADARDSGREPRAPHVEHGGVHQVVAGAYFEPSWATLRKLPLRELRKILGSAVYDDRRKTYDAQALDRLLRALWLAPDAPLLHSTARELYPVFRRRVRDEFQLYGCVRRTVAGDLDRLEQEFRALPPVEGGAEVPAWELVYSDGPADRRPFYAWLVFAKDVPAHCGLPPGEVAHVDVGFWVRRFEDGTADALGGWLRKVLAAYDAAWLKQLEASPPAPFTATRAWWNGEPVEFVELGPETLTVRTAAGDGVEASAREVSFEPPAPPPAYADPNAGDHLVSSEVPSGPTFYGPGGKELLAFGRDVRWLDGATLAPLRSRPYLPEGEHVQDGSRSGDGKVVVLSVAGKDSSSGAVLVLDTATGETLERIDCESWCHHPVVNQDGSIVAVWKNKADVVEVRFRGEPGRAPLMLRTRAPLALHPTVPLLVAGRTSAEVWDLRTGAKVADGRRPDTYRRAFSPDGRRLYSGAEGGAVVERFDAASFVFKLERKLPPDTGGTWIDPDRLWLEADGVTWVRNLTTGKDEGRKVRAGRTVAATPDGRWLLLDLEGRGLVWSSR